MPAISILSSLIDEPIHIEYSCASTRSQPEPDRRFFMESRHGFSAAFVLTFWLEKAGKRERILLDLIGSCPDDTCGGKLHIIVCVGYIEEGSYRVKNPYALWHDEEFPLRTELICTNCNGIAILPEDAADAISVSAGEFTQGFKEARRASKASSN